jgi:hypothetical protein
MQTDQTRRAAPWMAGAFLGGFTIAATVLVIHGAGHRGTVAALRLSARWAYGFFWLAYVGGALAALFGPRFRPLARRGRELGLGFAAAMLVHASMVVRIYAISAHPPIPLASAIYFGVGLAFVYLMALFSIPALTARLSAGVRRLLFTVGMEYVALAFLRDFLHDPLGHGIKNFLAYMPFLALAFSAALLRTALYAMRLWRWIGSLRVRASTAAPPRISAAER